MKQKKTKQQQKKLNRYKVKKNNNQAYGVCPYPVIWEGVSLHLYFLYLFID